ncbi:Hsp33 family molecular chaperone HslO [Opitutus sp. ER46]|uniref:Hsp33 family molecular chaperone HslO n=1 Tax=Opitutus sp. ER46 TaxID=2161864 RepID=UPI000D318522|nr:Hsp33 family molecular chaperone HslO [Opitutus sp. ER46]PTY00079.1 disulfide bond chaperone [Opitutus sp. ER46]
MPETTPPNPAEPGLEVRTYFVRNRNALLARADFGDLFVDYYLHLGAHHIRVAPEHDAMFKRALAVFTLHSASRPWNEMTAWTMNFQAPLVNLFLTSDNDTGAVTGRVFDENVKEGPENLFFADVVRGNQPKRRSMVSFEGSDPVAAVEKFYAQSEQRGARIFQLGDEDFAMVSEHPDCDLTWFRQLDVEQVRILDQHEQLVLLERRIQRWHCGCNQQRMMQVLAPTMQQDPEGLFGIDPKLEIRCPRCGARHTITREAMEAYLAQSRQKPEAGGQKPEA